MTEYRPSPLVRWPLYLMNALFVLVALVLAATVAFYLFIDEPPPWTLVGVSAAVLALLFFVNLAVARLRLRVDDRGVRLLVWPWRRRVSWKGVRLAKTVRAVGVVGVRLRDDRCRELYLNPAWFKDFDRALAEIERRVREAGGEIGLTAD